MVTTAELHSLEQDILTTSGQPGPQEKRLPPALEARRQALLAQHLGFAPIQPLPRLHVVGDSHTAFFGGAENIRFGTGRRVWTGFFRARFVSAFVELLPVFRVFHVGPATAWQADEPGSSTRAREKIDALLRHRDIPAGAAILLVFGEIDCRCHIPKAILAGRPLATAVEATINRYLRLVTRLQARGYRPALWLPSLIPLFGDMGNPDDTHALPAVGPQALREEVTQHFCAELARAGAALGVASARPHPPAGMPPEKYFLDGHHLSQRMMPATLAALLQSDILPLRASSSARLLAADSKP